ncbi:MAG TPA: HlyD family type I secretion periplasmic adaptor subunit [Ramlibacter sp.]|uniref:HlyD family type I secretion periplasmic adaptor subunit n=1 Tax=Ramlibacter sp. TaxID=1917967 RepID=UPI002BB434BB|nr:HlyD family type I secretion periplasmic adaptor subunit [Ramlibacter sp.]HVZ45073.1 HlyD family type I secretion periplasmic adaptor subunit [Ramlibacter sp.]
MSLKYRAQAYAELWRRYRNIFAHYWAQREQLSGKLLNEHEAEFLPAALSLQSMPVSPVGRLVAKVLMSIVAALLIWSVVGKMDIVVNARGKVIPSGNTKAIASVDVASVRALYVEDGQPVKAGEVLMELDSSAQDAEHDKASGDQSVALLQAARAKALIAAIDTGMPARLPPVAQASPEQWREAQAHLQSQCQDFYARLKRIDGEIDYFKEALPLATRRADDFKQLRLTNDVSEHAWIEKEQARMDIARQLSDARNQRSALIGETRRTAYEQMTEGYKVAAASEQDALRSGTRSKLLKLTAPVNGTVQQLNVHTVGGVVPAATTLMLIVPESKRVEVTAFIENKDVGFVFDGQAAEVKVDAFPYTKYGTASGRVTHVSRDAIEDKDKGLLYEVTVTLDKTTMDIDGRPMNLSPGMSVDVEIKTGDRRIIEYVLSPLQQHARESLNER